MKSQFVRGGDTHSALGIGFFTKRKFRDVPHFSSSVFDNLPIILRVPKDEVKDKLIEMALADPEYSSGIISIGLFRGVIDYFDASPSNPIYVGKRPVWNLAYLGSAGSMRIEPSAESWTFYLRAHLDAFGLDRANINRLRNERKLQGDTI
jgi:hypothetical protein